MAGIQQDIDIFLNKAQQKVAAIGIESATREKSGLYCYDHIIDIQKLKSAISILMCDDCGNCTLTDDEIYEIMSFYNDEYELTILPIADFDNNCLVNNVIINSGGYLIGPAGPTGPIGLPGATGATGATGADGVDGADGEDGWEAITALVTDGLRIVARVTGWAGGTGTPPTSGYYIGPSGFVINIADATDVRGPQGLQGIQGIQGLVGADGENAFVYAAYADDNTGTGFTTTFDATKYYIAILTTTTEILSPGVSDFVGLWFKWKGEVGPAFALDARGDLVDRALYDSAVPPFAFLAEDTGNVYFKESAIPGDWSGPVSFVGDKGWSPVYAIVDDGDRRVYQLVDWVGGDGAVPATGDYVGPVGLVPDIASAVDIRGPQGRAFFPDAEDVFANRSTYDAQLKDFIFYATDTGLVYIKLSDTSGDWSTGVQWQGPQGIQGVNAYTALTSSFIQPAISGFVTVDVVDTSWISTGQVLYIESGGYYEVAGVIDGDTVSLQNLGSSGNVISGATVLNASKVSPAGPEGSGGSVGNNGLNSVTAGEIRLGGTIVEDTTLDFTGAFDFTIDDVNVFSLSGAYGYISTANDFNIASNTWVFIQGENSYLSINDNAVVLHSHKSGASKYELNLNPYNGWAKFLDSNASPAGLQYGADYSATYTSRSLVDYGTMQTAINAASFGLSWKNPVVVATTANITLSGEQTIDGILTSASRVLVKDQSTASGNGIYVTASGAWTRSTDADSAAELEGATVLVQKGSVNADRVYTQTADGITLGSTSLVWSQISGGVTAWGTITGTLSAQTDLQTALNAKAATSTTLNINGVSQDLSANRTWRTALGDTGALTYAGISVASGTQVNIGACTGRIVNNETVPGVPTYTDVTYAGATNVTVTTVGTGLASYVLLNSSGTIVFQNTFPTSAERKSMIFLSKIGHPAGTITTAGDEVDFITSPLAQHRDLFEAISYINSNVVASASGATLNFALSAGTITGKGINFVTDKTNPDKYVVTAQPTASFLKRTQTGAGGGFVSLIDVANYDVGGTITAIPGGGATSTLQYIYYVPPLGLIVQYGQTTYSSLANAAAQVGKESFVLYPSLDRNAILIGILAVTKSATALNNTSQAMFFRVSKFGDATGSSGGISVSTMQNTYNNSGTASPKVLTSTTNGAIQWQRGSAADSDKVIELLNGAGSSKWSVTGAGNETANSFIKSGGTSSQFLKADGSVDSTTYDSTTTTPIGSIFTESWASLANWGNVGTPSASVTGGKVSFAGTASTTTNYIRNTSYGKNNFENMVLTWTETVGTIGASTNGIAFAFQSNGSLGSSYSNSIMVNVDLTSGSNKGKIVWYWNGSAVRTSDNFLTPVATNVLNCRLVQYPDKYYFEYDIGGGAPIGDTFIVNTGIGFTTILNNASEYAFFNLGGGSSHAVGAFAVSCFQGAGADLLMVGNSIFSGYSNNYFYNRAITQVQKRAKAIIEVYARPSNSVNDINTAEITLLNPRKILLMPCSNDILVNGSTTALANLATMVASLAALTPSNAPSGYSVANGNLVFGTELPRIGIAGIATYNTSIISTYGIANIINFYGVASKGTTSMPTDYSFDTVHPNDVLNSIMADMIIKYFGYTRKTTYTNNEFFTYNPPSALNTNVGPEVYFTNSAGYKGLAFNAFVQGGLFVARDVTSSTIITVDPTTGLSIYSKSGNTVGSSFAPLKRFGIDYSGNISTNGTSSTTYRSTNAGADVSAHMLIDPANSVTSGNGFSFDSTNGLGFTRANGTRRIQRAAIQITNNTDTPGSEASDLIILIQSGGTAAVERFRVTSAGISATNLSGTNTGDQTITLTGDVSGSGTGSFTITISSNAVTYPKSYNGIQNAIVSSMKMFTGN